jgi:hypothetical protein
MSKRVSRRSSLPVALGACLLTAPLGAGCSSSSGIDPNIKVVDGPTTEESTKSNPQLKSKKAAAPAPEQRRTGRPG